MTPGATRSSRTRAPDRGGGAGPRARDARRGGERVGAIERARGERTARGRQPAREKTRAFRGERDALRESAAVFKAEIRREKETEAKIAEMNVVFANAKTTC